MGFYSITYEGYSTTAGVLPSDWTFRWGGDPATNTTVWQTVTAFSGATVGKSGQVLQEKGSTGSSTRRILSYNPMDGYVGDFDVLVKWRATDVTANAIVSRIFCCAGGTSITSTDHVGYGCYFSNTDRYIRIARYNAGSFQQIGSATTAIAAYTVGEWMWIRFRRRGDSFLVKCWRDADVEPASFQVSGNDPNIPSKYTGGWYGVGTGPITGEKEWDFVQFATGTDEAVCPNINAMRLGISSGIMGHFQLGNNPVQRMYKGDVMVWSNGITPPTGLPPAYRYIRINDISATTDVGYNEFQVFSTASGNVALNKLPVMNPPIDGTSVYGNLAMLVDGVTTEATGSGAYFVANHTCQADIDLGQTYTDLTTVQITMNATYQVDVANTQVKCSTDGVSFTPATYQTTTGNTVIFKVV